MIKTTAILCTIFEEIVQEEQLPVLNDHLIKLDLVPTNLITNLPHAIPPKLCVITKKKAIKDHCLSNITMC